MNNNFELIRAKYSKRDHHQTEKLIYFMSLFFKLGLNPKGKYKVKDLCTIVNICAKTVTNYVDAINITWAEHHINYQIKLINHYYQLIELK